jgi:hypothetical protein
VALTRHRESVAIFAARDTTANLDQLARQMGRDETKRAAISFIVDDDRFKRERRKRLEMEDRRLSRTAAGSQRSRDTVAEGNAAQATPDRHDASTSAARLDADQQHRPGNRDTKSDAISPFYAATASINFCTPRILSARRML